MAVTQDLKTDGRLSPDVHASRQGFKSTTPVASKSDTLRVTTVNLFSRAVAAINASRSERGLGMCSAAQTGAVFSANGKIRLAKAARTPASQMRKALP